MSDQPGPIAQIVAKYIELRDLKASKKAAYEAEIAPIDAALSKCEGYLLRQMQEQGVDSYKTAAGTAYSHTKTSATVADWDMLLPFIQQHNHWNMLEKRVNKTAVDEYRAANDDLPPGVTYRQEIAIGIRRS